MHLDDYGSAPTDTKALINREVIPYDACADTRNVSLEKAKEFYHLYEYMGKGTIYSIDGHIQHFTYKHYFFKRK